MADDQQNTDPQKDSGDAEKQFWDKFGAAFDSRMDAWWNKTKTEAEKNRAPGTSRTGSKRVTLPGLIADIVFGPDKDA